MTLIKPIRSFILSLAGKVITGEDFNDHDRRAIAGFKDAFPDLQNPVHVRCSVEGHRSGGAVVFPDEGHRWWPCREHSRAERRMDLHAMRRRKERPSGRRQSAVTMILCA
jgi:hypothetical protein